MEIEKYVSYIKDKKTIGIPELQTALNISYKDARAAATELERRGLTGGEADGICAFVNEKYLNRRDMTDEEFYACIYSLSAPARTYLRTMIGLSSSAEREEEHYLREEGLEQDTEPSTAPQNDINTDIICGTVFRDIFDDIDIDGDNCLDDDEDEDCCDDGQYWFDIKPTEELDELMAAQVFHEFCGRYYLSVSDASFVRLRHSVLIRSNDIELAYFAHPIMEELIRHDVSPVLALSSFVSSKTLKYIMESREMHRLIGKIPPHTFESYVRDCGLVDVLISVFNAKVSFESKEEYDREAVFSSDLLFNTGVCPESVICALTEAVDIMINEPDPYLSTRRRKKRD